jgi:hypothetical protein
VFESTRSTQVLFTFVPPPRSVTAQHHRDLDQRSVGAERARVTSNSPKVTKLTENTSLTRSVKIETMSPTPRETIWVTDEETDEASRRSECWTEDERAKTQKREAWQERLRRGVRKLTNMGPRGNHIPDVGTHCIVMVGNARQEVGQLAQVTHQTAKMVEIQFRGSKNRRLEHKRKHPSSLIMLEDGLTLKQDVHGTVWVCRQTK